MKYQLAAYADDKSEGVVKNGKNEIQFGVTGESDLSSPAELLVAAFSACCLKNIQRFSKMMRFSYEHATIDVVAERQDKPPMINVINYEIIITSSDNEINKDLLHRNIQKFGTIYNTLNVVCEINGNLTVKPIV